MKSILVVCEGNICRSPMAQGLLAHALPGLQVDSAGLGALIGSPPDDIAVRLMRERGIDIRAHRAVQITRQHCLLADLVLVMEHQQLQRLAEQHPQTRGRIFRVAEHARRDVPDPYRQHEEAFREALALIEAGVNDWLPRIHRISQASA